jgi:hypothetical protein
MQGSRGEGEQRRFLVYLSTCFPVYYTKQVLQHTLNRSRDASTEQCIHDDRALTEPLFQRDKICVILRARDGQVARAAQFPIFIRVALDALPNVQSHLCAGIVQIARADQAIAAIVARSDEDEHALLARVPSRGDCVGNGFAGALHHHRVRVSACICTLFERAHLVCGE